MFLEKHLHYHHLSNNSATSGFVWEKFDFALCKNFRGLQIIWSVCIMLGFAFGFPACIAILWDMFKIHSRGTPFTPNSFFLLNLSIMDVIFLFFIPAGLLNHLIWGHWVLEASWNAIFALNTCGRPLLMACICLDCYLAVVHPIIYHKTKNLTPRVVMVGVVWGFTVAYGIAYFLFYKLHLSFIAILPFMVAIIIIGFCDSFIFHTLFKSDPGKKNIHPQKKRAVQTLINSLVVSVLSYLPPILILTIGKHLYSNPSSLICTMAIPLSVAATLGSAVMPLLHLNNIGKLDCFKLGDAGILNSYKIRCCRGKKK